MTKGQEKKHNRNLEDMRDLHRSPLQAHNRTQADLFRRKVDVEELVEDLVEFDELADLKSPSEYANLLKDFLSIRVFSWLRHYLASRFGARHPFPDYTTQSDDNGVYRLDKSAAGDEEIRIGLAGDWASGVYEADVVGRMMRKFQPHFTIHLGDTYFVGTQQEIEENFFSVVKWPLGSRGSFAVNGNHEMYAKGKAYFEYLLPRLGMRGAERTFQGQKASYFCLENDHWRIIALDTAYHALGIPIVEKLSRANCTLTGAQRRWLKDEVFKTDDKRGVIFLSHHQYFSAFETAYSRPGIQLARILDRPVLWIWAHEHRMAVYKKGQVGDGMEVYGRCIGHGGMPVEIGYPPDKRSGRDFLVAYDDRRSRFADGHPVGYNGFANMTVKGDEVTIDYRDIENQSMLSETWVANNATGQIRGIDIQLKQPELTLVRGLTEAIS